MPYGEFSIEEVKARFQLQIAEAEEYFAGIPPVTVSDFLSATLSENIPLKGGHDEGGGALHVRRKLSSSKRAIVDLWEEH